VPIDVAAMAAAVATIAAVAPAVAGCRTWHAAACSGRHLATMNELPPFLGPTG